MQKTLAIKKLVLALSVCAAGAGTLSAQAPSFDSSGNSQLNGTYYFRQVVYFVGDNIGNLNAARALYGNISFDGNGHYSISGGTVVDSASSSLRSLSQTGTYSLAASGYGFLSSLLNGGTPVYVLLSKGVLIGSTTEDSATQGPVNDVFIAAQVPSPTPVNSSFQGSWAMAGFLPGGSPSFAADVFFPMNPDGQGNLGTVNVSGYAGGSGTQVLTQTSANVKYNFSSGAAIVTFPTSNTAFYYSGQEYLYFSPDGNFAFGGSPNGYDMLVGVRNDAAGTVEDFSGIYYQGGIDQDLSTYSSRGYANLDTYYGSFSATGGALIGTQRLQSLFQPNTFTSTFTDTYPTTITGSSPVSDAFTKYAVGDGGAVRIGAGIWPFLGLTVAVKAPVLTGSGVFLNPMGVTNAASSAGFTAGVANGELLTLYGSNLAPPSTVLISGIPFQNTLGGVQVLINGTAAPIYYVSPGQVSVIVPYGNTFPVVQIQVINNGTPSNTVTEFVRNTAVGMFTVPPGGTGYGALLHNSNGSLVSPSNPAQPGEFIQAYVTGLGNVFPSISDGAAGPSDNFSSSIYFNTDPTKNQITASVGGVTASVVFAGLAPNLAGLYQINFQVPATGLTAGDNTLDIGGPDSFSAQTLISIGTGTAGTTSAASPKAAPGRLPARRPSSMLDFRTGPKTVSAPSN